MQKIFLDKEICAILHSAKGLAYKNWKFFEIELLITGLSLSLNHSGHVLNNFDGNIARCVMDKRIRIVFGVVVGIFIIILNSCGMQVNPQLRF
jgi:hypothetical protein